MMMINRFRKNNYVLLLLTKVLTKHMLITGQSHNINIHGINLIIKSLESDDEYQKVMNKLDHMSENITKDTVKISITDPDAHNMEDKDKNWGFHYNLQEITDTKCGVIVDHYICKNPNDKNFLI